MTILCFAGDGWGAVAAVKSLQPVFPVLEIVSSDPEILSLMRTSDRNIPTIDQSSAALAVCAGYKGILSARLLSKMPAVNVHYSLLPKFRGLHSTVWAMLNGETEHGLTVHLMAEEIDAGPILAQYRFKYQGETSRMIMEQCNVWVQDNLGRTVSEYLKGNIQPVFQDHSQATWVCKRNLADCLIDFNASCEYLERFFKALVRPYPLPMIGIEDYIYEVVDADIIRRPYHTDTGRVVNVDADGAWIKTSDGFLVVKVLENNGRVIKAPLVLKMGQRL
jgi:methionyl-tRNA formyltransferase